MTTLTNKARAESPGVKGARDRKHTWPLARAKAKLSEVVDAAKNDGAQFILKRGKPEAVVLAYETYVEQQRPKRSIAKFFLEGPLAGTEIAVERLDDGARAIEL